MIKKKSKAKDPSSSGKQKSHHEQTRNIEEFMENRKQKERTQGLKYEKGSVKKTGENPI